MKVCWVSLIGRPNVGKSTLINNLIKYDLSIVSPIAQTTRDNISGVYTDKEYQIIFCDTPGIHKPLSRFGEHLNKKSLNSIEEADLILFLNPINQEISKGDNFIIEQINNKKNKIAIITKSDLVNNELEFFERKKLLNKIGFEKSILVSQKDPKTYEDLLEEIKKYAYNDEKFYDDDYITDKTELFLVKEIIRSSAIKFLHDEIPHSIVIEITKYEINDNENKRYIEANIYCKKNSQKGIIIGKNGSMIKKIGTHARKEIINKFNSNVHLDIFVKVDNNWIDNEKSIKKYGY